MRIRIDYSLLIGSEYGRLTVIKILQRNQRYEMLLLCSCVCGSVIDVRYPSLKSGGTKSCGCLQPEVARLNGRNNFKHGQIYSITYSTWRSVLARCHNKSNISYPNYGGRGIKVCDRWLKFENFLADIGERPSKKHTIDRINNFGDYEPSNCRWATSTEQARNLRKNRWITVNGITLIMSDWAKKIGVAPTTILDRLKAGWTEEDAVTKPPSELTALKVYIVNGEYLSRRQISKKFGVRPHVLGARILRGLSVEEAISTPLEAKNRSEKLTVDGETRSYHEWSDISGLPRYLIRNRIKKGWSPNDALNTPSQKNKLGIKLKCHNL